MIAMKKFNTISYPPIMIVIKPDEYMICNINKNIYNIYSILNHTFKRHISLKVK